MRKLIVALAAVGMAASGCSSFTGIYDIPLPGGADLGDHPFTVKARFKDVLDLVPQSGVKVNEVPVGRVEDIHLAPDGWTAEVTMRINGDVDLPANALAMLRQSSLLGEKYVELSPPPPARSSGRLANGALIPIEHTNRNTDIEEVLGALSMLLNGGGIEQLQTIAQEMNNALSGNETDIRKTLGSVDHLVSTLDESKSDITHAIDGVGRLAGTLNDEKDQLAGVIDSLGPGLKVLTDQRGQLVRMLQSLQSLSDVAVRTVDESQADLVADLKALTPALRKLGDAGADLPKSLQILFTIPFTDEAVNGVKGDYFNLYAKVDLNLQDVVDNLSRSRRSPLEDLPILGDVIGGKPGDGGSQLPIPNSQAPGSSEGGLAGILDGILGGWWLMLTRRVRLQLIAFVVIAVVAVVYALFRFTDLGKVFGAEGYTVRMNLDDSGGIFTNAEVTYRGYNVGRVGEIRLTHAGLQVDLNIDPDAPDIPADLDAVVANRSAVGEQYVDLRPRESSGPYLSAESVIAADRTKTPVATDAVIRDLDSLASSVPTESLRTLVDELDLAFSGTGDDLQVLLDTTSEFTNTATQHLPQTVALINDGGTVLDTQAAQTGNIKSFASDLNLLAQQLRKSDPDLRRLITAAPGAATSITNLLRESGPGLSQLFANLLTVSDIVGARKDGLEYTLVSYPLFSAAGQGLLAADPGQAHLGLVLNLFNPPPCTKGYEKTPRRNGTDTQSPPKPVPGSTYCAEPPGSPVNVRGSNNVPLGGRPQEPSTPGTGPQPGGGQQAGLARGSLPGTLTEPGSATQPSLAQLLGLPA